MKIFCKLARHYILLNFAALLLLLAACGSSEADGDGRAIAPTDEVQIETAVENYFRRDPNIPEYVAEVEAVVDDWARVSLSVAGVDNAGGKVLVYVQDQVNTPNPVPTAELMLSDTMHDAEISTDLGWAIITPPQAHFTDEELDAAMVPEAIRP